MKIAGQKMSEANIDSCSRSIRILLGTRTLHALFRIVLNAEPVMEKYIPAKNALIISHIVYGRIDCAINMRNAVKGNYSSKR